jgi:hypothetical protein
MKKLVSMCAALAAVVVSGQALASSHSEAPGTASDPDIDNADVWAWVDTADPTTLNIVATFNGLQPPFAAPNWKKFADDALYEIHIARGAADLLPDLTYQFRFSTAPYPTVDPGDHALNPGGGKEFFAQLSGGGAFAQTYSITKIEDGTPTVLAENVPVAPPNVGPSTNNFIQTGNPFNNTANYETYYLSGGTSVITSLGTGQGRVFAGPRDDAFYVDLGGVFDLARLRSVVPGTTPRNSTAYTNVMTIALEVPVDVANGAAVTPDPAGDVNQTIGVWSTASRRKVRILRQDGTDDGFGPWQQVSRLGLPLINEAVIGLQDKDYWNRLSPKDDVTYFGAYFLNPVVVRDAAFLGYYGGGPSPITPLAGCVAGAFQLDDLTGEAAPRLDIIDVISLTNIPAAGAHNFPLATSVGDVLRVDLGLDPNVVGFPNGRALTQSAANLVTEPDVVDIELGLLLCALQTTIPDGVGQSERANKATFPYMNSPHESFAASVYPGPNPN